MLKASALKNTAILILAAIIVFLLFKYVFSLILPFIIALAIAFILSPAIKILHKRTHISKKVLSGFTISTLLLLIGFTLFLITNKILGEFKNFFASLSENSDKYISDFFSFVDRISQKLPFIDAMGTDLSEAVSDAVSNMLTVFTTKLPSIISSFIAMLPHVLLFTVIIILASYYFCADFDRIKERILSFLPNEVKDGLSRFKTRLADTGIKYLKACVIMLIITYFELLVGFLMLRIPYSFSLALVVAAVDMLPIFGVGTALIPWAIWCKLTGDTYTAIGLIIIFATVTVIRRFIEPKIISSGIGLSPITTLVAMYVGFRLLGLFGLFVSPLLAILILHALPEALAKKLGFNAQSDSNTKAEASQVNGK